METKPRLNSPGDSVIGWIIAFCLRNRFVVLAVATVVLAWGVYVAPFDWNIGGIERNPVPVDAIPDIGENQQIVFTTWMGRSPQDIEDQITYPLTSSLLALPGVKTVRSLSMFGFSTIYIIFEEGVEFYWSRDRVLEKLSSLPAGTLPEGVRPTLGPDATPLGQVFWYTLEGRDADGNPAGGWDLNELRAIQDWQVRLELLAVPGVAEAASVGGFVQEYQVEVDPDSLFAHGVSLAEVAGALSSSNIDVGARTLEINKVDYVIRGLGFVKEIADIESAVVKVVDNVPVRVGEVATVSLGPALRRGALDKGGAEAVGGVVVVRYGANPLEVIKAVKEKIEEFAPALPKKTVNVRLSDGTFKEVESRVTVIPFYDRTGLIYETLGTLNNALTDEIMVTIIVVVVLLMHLGSSILISGLLPLAVLICFVAMKQFGVDANIVALSGIAIAIGTMVDIGIVLTENIFKHLREAPEGDSSLQTIYKAATEVGGAVTTAVATTIIGFIPVFAMEAAEGKLFKPLAFTKTFALTASLVIALTLIPPLAHAFFGREGRARKIAAGVVVAAIALVVSVVVGSWLLAIVVVGVWAYRVATWLLPEKYEKWLTRFSNWAAAAGVAYVLTSHWMPLGVDSGTAKNLAFVVCLVGGILLFFRLFLAAYPYLLRLCLAFKTAFLALPAAVFFFGLTIWLGMAKSAPIISATAAAALALLLLWVVVLLLSYAFGAKRRPAVLIAPLAVLVIGFAAWLWFHNSFVAPAEKKTGDTAEAAPVKRTLRTRAMHAFPGLGKEFMPPLDEGSYLFMPTTMPHASIGEAMDVLRKQDMAIHAIPEVETAVGKIGRVESPLDPAPISMIETIINYLPEYKTDRDGNRLSFKLDPGEVDFFRDESGEAVPALDGFPYLVMGKFARDENGSLVPDGKGKPFRLWRPALDAGLNPNREAWHGIREPDDIWDEIVRVTAIPGTTSAPRLQPIAARIVMLQSGMRAPMGVKITGKGKVSLETLEKFGLDIEALLKQVPTINAATVSAERIVGKPYLEIDIDRNAISRHGISIRKIQMVIETAVGGEETTTTVEGRERYSVRLRYKRELRDSIEGLEQVLVPAAGGAQIPLKQLIKGREIRYKRGPMVIKSEDGALVSYVLFDMHPGNAEVNVVNSADAYLKNALDAGRLELPEGVSFSFAGSYENQVRSEKRLMIVVPLALALIFIVLYLQFKSALTTGMVFSGVAVAMSGGFVMIWLYGQGWFCDFYVFGLNMRDLFQMHQINMSVAIWVGFIALFGIATDDGVVMATFIKQTFAGEKPATIKGVRAATLHAAQRRIRPCLMTTATTILALVPILTSTGRGADIMIPMAIPSFGGMSIEILTMFVVPVLYSSAEEAKLVLTELVAGIGRMFGKGL